MRKCWLLLEKELIIFWNIILGKSTYQPGAPTTNIQHRHTTPVLYQQSLCVKGILSRWHYHVPQKLLDETESLEMESQLDSQPRQLSPWLPLQWRAKEIKQSTFGTVNQCWWTYICLSTWTPWLMFIKLVISITSVNPLSLWLMKLSFNWSHSARCLQEEK